VWRATRTLSDAFSHAFALGALMAFVHAAVEALASSMYESSPRIYLLFGAFAVALALARAARSEPVQPDRLAAD
jgi:ABC-type Mn2+/Zn2+ transport system permease subunit